MSERETARRELASRVLIKERTLNAMSDEQRKRLLENAISQAFAHRLVVDGARVEKTQVELDWDISYRGWEINVFADVESDPRLRSVLASMQYRHQRLFAAILAVENLSWWRWAWLKLRGRPIVEITVD